jgi:hypothetical protein
MTAVDMAALAVAVIPKYLISALAVNMPLTDTKLLSLENWDITMLLNLFAVVA